MASIKITGLVTLASVVIGGPSFAQQGTEAQREACTPDAFRLCMSAMPDAGRVEGCLRSNSPRLSAACNAVFNPPQQQAETTGQIRERGSRMQRDVQRQPQRDDEQRRYEQRFDQPRDARRDDGFDRREFQSRPQPQYDDD